MKTSLAIAYNIKKHMAKRKGASHKSHLDEKAVEQEKMLAPIEPMEHEGMDPEEMPAEMHARGGMIGNIMRKKFGYGGPVGAEDFMTRDMPEMAYTEHGESYPDPDNTEHEESLPPRKKMVHNILERLRSRHSGK